MPDADVRYEEEYVTGANGKRELIRKLLRRNSGVFVFSDLDKFDPRFMSLILVTDTNKLLKWTLRLSFWKKGS